jgi:hypothetical protein
MSRVKRVFRDLPNITPIASTKILVTDQNDFALGYANINSLISTVDGNGLATDTDIQTLSASIAAINNSNNTTSGSNIDTLGGTSIRTLYTKDSDTIYTSGSVNTDFLSGSLNWGSRTLPQSFFDDSVNYVGKILHFRAVGKFASGGGDHTSGSIRLQIGDQIISGSDLGLQKFEFSRNHPFEIMGEVVITGGNATTCYAIKYCDQTGDLKALSLGDVTLSGSFSTLSPGDFKVIVSGSTNRNMTSYYSYFQVMN